MKFEFDPIKQYINLAKHGVGFEEAAHIFLDANRLDEVDDRRDYKEQRRIVLGQVQNRVLVIVYTLRGKIIRLISARKANEREQKKYYAIRDESC